MEAIRAGLKSPGDEDSLGDELIREVYVIEDKIVEMEARSLAGALGQLILAASLFEHLTSLAEEPDRHKVAVKIVPLLWSIRRVLERESGASGEEFGANQYMSDHSDPFRAAADLPAVEAQLRSTLAALSALPAKAADDVTEPLFQRIEEARSQIAEAPAENWADLAVKIRLLRRLETDADVDPDSPEMEAHLSTWQVALFRTLLDGIERFGARGQDITPTSAGGPDPVLTLLIELKRLEEQCRELSGYKHGSPEEKIYEGITAQEGDLLSKIVRTEPTTWRGVVLLWESMMADSEEVDCLAGLHSLRRALITLGVKELEDVRERPARSMETLAWGLPEQDIERLAAKT